MKPTDYRIRRSQAPMGEIVQELRALVSAEGWVMYRVKGAGTYTMPLKEWEALERRNGGGA